MRQNHVTIVARPWENGGHLSLYSALWLSSGIQSNSIACHVMPDIITDEFDSDTKYLQSPTSRHEPQKADRYGHNRELATLRCVNETSTQRGIIKYLSNNKRAIS